MAKLKHALIDVDFKDKPKVLELEDRFGLAARLLFIDIICTLSKSSNGFMSRGAIRLLGLRCNFNSEQTTEIINFCVSLDMLHESDQGISNTRVTKDQENYTNKLKRDNEYQAKKKRIASESEPILDIDLVFDNDLNKKNSQPEKQIPKTQGSGCETQSKAQLYSDSTQKHPDIPAFFKIENSIYYKTLLKWQKYLRKFNKNLGDDQLEIISSQASKAKLSPEDFLNFVDYCASKDYRSLIWSEAYSKPWQQKAHEKPVQARVQPKLYKAPEPIPEHERVDKSNLSALLEQSKKNLRTMGVVK